MSYVELKQKNDSQSYALQRLLTTIYKNEIQNDPDLKAGASISMVKRKVGRKLNNIVRRYFTRNYQRGGQYATDILKLESYPYYDLSIEDKQIVDDTIKQYMEKFWLRVEKIERRNQGLEAKQNSSGELLLGVTDIHINSKGEEIQLEEMNRISFLEGAAGWLIYSSFNLGIANAPRQIINDIEENSGITLDQDEINYVTNMFMFKFKTKNDPRVDPLMCLPLKNKTFPMDSRNLPLPPLHVHCRCILTIVQVRDPKGRFSYHKVGEVERLKYPQKRA